MKPEIYKRLSHGMLRLSEARRRMMRQLVMRLLRIPWNQTLAVLYSPNDIGGVEIIREVIPSKLISFQSSTAINSSFSHHFKPRMSVRLSDPLIDLTSGDVFVWDEGKSRWLLVEETSEWPIEYRIQFARIPNNSRRYPRLKGSYVNGIFSNSYYHRLTEDIPTLLTLGDKDPILARKRDERFLSNFTLRNFRRVEDSGFIQVDILTILTKGSDVGYLLPDYRDTLRSSIVNNPRQAAKRLLYLTRIDERRSIPNEPEILELMNSMKFEIVSPEKLKISEQVSLFSEAKLVVAPHGGALTNLIFADNAEIIEIMPRTRVNRCFEWQSKICKHDYTRILIDETGLNSLSLKSLVLARITR